MFHSFLVELLSSWVSGLYQLYTLLGVTAVLNDSFLGFGSQTRRCYKKKIQRCCIIEVVVFIQIYLLLPRNNMKVSAENSWPGSWYMSMFYIPMLNSSLFPYTCIMYQHGVLNLGKVLMNYSIMHKKWTTPNKMVCS